MAREKGGEGARKSGMADRRGEILVEMNGF